MVKMLISALIINVAYGKTYRDLRINLISGTERNLDYRIISRLICRADLDAAEIPERRNETMIAAVGVF